MPPPRHVRPRCSRRAPAARGDADRGPPAYRDPAEARLRPTGASAATPRRAAPFLSRTPGPARPRSRPRDPPPSPSPPPPPVQGLPQERSGRGAGGRPLLPSSPLSHLVYALCGHGRGHSSRALAVASALRARGHRVTFATGGPAAERVAGAGRVYAVPGLRQVLRGNRVRMGATAWANLPLTWRSPEVIAEAADWLREAGADAVVADHEPFLPRAARRAGVPVVALSHQLLLTETRPDVPLGLRPSAWATRVGVRFLAGPHDAAVVPSFFFPPRRAGSEAVFVPPILRDDVLALRPRPGGRVLAYANEGDGMEPLLAALAGVPADVYGLDPATPAPEGVVLKPPSRAGFLADLAAARAVVSTAGFTLLSEALHLGVPVLALPNRGFFEQAVNALALAELGRGEAVLGRDVRAADVHGFLDRAERYRRPPGADGAAGREAAADAIERALGLRSEAVLTAAA